MTHAEFKKALGERIVIRYDKETGNDSIAELNQLLRLIDKTALDPSYALETLLEHCGRFENNFAFYRVGTLADVVSTKKVKS